VTHLWAVILGVVQGLAEFLPISSTAHLKLVPWIFGVSDPMLSSAAFDIALHAGSLVAIVAALWVDWVALFTAALGGTGSGRHDENLSKDAVISKSFARRFLGFLLLTSIPGALFGVALDSKLEQFSTPDIAGQARTGIDAATYHNAPLVLGVCMIVFGVVLWAADKYTVRKEPLEKMNWVKALLIGAGQALALIPGVSRSGATMTVGRLVGLEREAVARYSFMAAAPIIGGAALWGLRKVPIATLLSLDWVLGFLAAAITSVLVMRWMLAYVKNHSFAIFMWYRIAFGALVLAIFFIRG
jgi:undecaprenyl-diphosphatase